MATHPHTPPLDNDSSVRKRVCKACDRCRLKKSKCDGVIPCVRCKADNAICVFGERKKTHDKVYPKGYVEMLEQQQTQLVNALQELYRRAIVGQEWDGPPLEDCGTGKPLTHDILNHLGVLQEPSGQATSFDDNFESMQQRLIEDGADILNRRSTPDSENDQSQISYLDSQAQQLNTTAYSVAQLPTPPAPSPQAQTQSWQNRHTPASSRSHSLQNMNYASWDPGMAPTMLAAQTWVDTPVKYEDPTIGFFPTDNYSNFENLPGAQPHISYDPMVVSDDISMPTWTEDDFSKFLN